ncbi:hypothetical protein ACET3X_009038 [Alternaria dauci]|uniref:PARP-type domain-containing protein n=1 Tax=Alternaria dauci TaxID=48095 RepID=A0ABR3UA75_9PLEO
MDDEGPKWRLEQATTGQATCNQAACKRSKIKIVIGELRIGTHTLFDDGMSSRWYMAWRHWGCATKHQIEGLKEVTGNDPTKAPGYDRLSPESQEQVRLAFEEGKPVDKTFKGIREDLAKDARKYAREYKNVSFYRVDVAGRICACRGGDCLAKNVKITKGELRLGLSVPFDGDHETMVYKHWKCLSAYDLEQVLILAGEDSIDGVDSLPVNLKVVVTKTLETGKIVEPPERTIESPKKPKKMRTKRSAVEQETDEKAAKAFEANIKVEKPEDATPQTLAAINVADVGYNVEEVAGALKVASGAASTEDTAAPVAKPKAEKSRAKKRSIKKVDTSSEEEPEYIPKKSRSRSNPFKELLA